MNNVLTHRERGDAKSIASQILSGQSELSNTDKVLLMMNNLDDMLNAAHLNSESDDRKSTLEEAYKSSGDEDDSEKLVLRINDLSPKAESRSKYSQMHGPIDGGAVKIIGEATPKMLAKITPSGADVQEGSELQQK